jgi:hypothetical protein
MRRAGDNDFRILRCGANDYRGRRCLAPLLIAYLGHVPIVYRSLIKHLNCGGTWGPDESGYGQLTDGLGTLGIGGTGACAVPIYHDPSLSYAEQSRLSSYTQLPTLVRHYTSPLDGAPTCFDLTNRGGWTPLGATFAGADLVLTGQFEVSLVPVLYAQDWTPGTVTEHSCCAPYSYTTRTLAVEDYEAGFAPYGFHGPDAAPSEDLIRSTIGRAWGTLDVQLTIVGVGAQQWEDAWAGTSLPLADGSGTDLRVVRGLLRGRSATVQCALNIPQLIARRIRTLASAEVYDILAAGYTRTYTQPVTASYDIGGRILASVTGDTLSFAGLSAGRSFGYHPHAGCDDGGTDYDYGTQSIPAGENFTVNLWLPYRS